MTAQRSNRMLVIAAVMASMAMIAIEATIVSTAMPQIAAQLGQINLYSWVFSSFLLAQTACTVIFGKLADVYGRKPIVLLGIAIFLVASILAGFAWSMPSMIAFRLLQGIGAGALQPVAMTVVGDLYPGAQRAKVQGYLASVWALSAVVGPLIGSVIIHNLPWAWIFWMNIPIGILAACCFVAFLHEDLTPRRVSIDFAGAGLFTLVIAGLMVALTDSEGMTVSSQIIALAISIGALVAFIWHERRVAEPMVSLSLWRLRPILSANVAIFFASISVMGLTTFLPMYVQTVLNQSPLVAGFALTMLLLGWPIAATTASRLFVRVGVRTIMLVGSLLIPIGTLLLVFLTPDSSPIQAGIGSLIMGLGMGSISICALMLIQESVDWSQRGSATASNVFARNLGSTLGAAVLGAVLTYGMNHSGSGVVVTSADLRDLLDLSKASAGADTAIRLALQHALHLTFIAMFVVAALIMVACWQVPQREVTAEPKPAGN